MNKESKIYIAGHMGMVGSAITKDLLSQDYKNLIFKTSLELDLRNQDEVNSFFLLNKPNIIKHILLLPSSNEYISRNY